MLPTATWAVVIAAAAALLVTLVGRRSASVATASARPVAPPRPWPAILAIAGFGVAWLLVVIVMTERGFSGNERYLIPPVALIIVAAAAGFGRLLPLIPVPGRAVLLAGVAVAIGVGAVQHVPEQMRRVLYESRMVDNLPKAIEQAGAPPGCAPVLRPRPTSSWCPRSRGTSGCTPTRSA